MQKVECSTTKLSESQYTEPVLQSRVLIAGVRVTSNVVATDFRDLEVNMKQSRSIISTVIMIAKTLSLQKQLRIAMRRCSRG